MDDRVGKTPGRARTQGDSTVETQRIEWRHLFSTALITVIFVVVTDMILPAPVLYVPPFAAVTYLIVSRERPRRRFWAPGVSVVLATGAGWFALVGAHAIVGSHFSTAAITPVATVVTVLLIGAILRGVDAYFPPAFATGLLVVLFDVNPARYFLTAVVGGVILTMTALLWHFLVDGQAEILN